MNDVLRTLASAVLDGHYPPGTMLPRENDLAAEYGVSRTVIREALKTMAAKGLVTIRSRVGTMVADPESWNIIDPQLLEWSNPEQLDPKLLDSILETRRAIEPLVAELAATRATMQEVADIEAAWRDMAEAGTNIPQFLYADLAFHRALYAASHNPIFRQIGNLLDAALRFALTSTGTHSADDRAQAVKTHFALVEALRLHDEAAARQAAIGILNLARHDLTITGNLKGQS